MRDVYSKQREPSSLATRSLVCVIKGEQLFLIRYMELRGAPAALSPTEFNIYLLNVRARLRVFMRQRRITHFARRQNTFYAQCAPISRTDLAAALYLCDSACKL